MPPSAAGSNISGTALFAPNWLTKYGKVCHGGGLNRYTDHDGSLPTDKVNKKEGTEKTTDQFYHSKDARGKQLLLLTTDASNEEEVRSVDGD
ncbi:hypothetical protein LTR09_011131 [Extremus antarcticus]|uniref:Uncharacterized protein n=1 Tax=Extremus antarcticus TaxID=702011 RepID=A0AAJ0G571_9PEZI|nr:hypothetical protein LTR09_011131 [Extremus antarcticus]